jgi:hypothetical protein
VPGKGEKATPEDIGNQPPSKPDPKAKREREEVFAQKENFTDLRNTRFREQTEQLKREHWVRMWASGCVFFFVLGWLFFVGLVVLLAGFAVLPQLSEKVLIALLATTTVTVVGLLAAVVRYLFPINPAIFGHDSLPVARGTRGQNRRSRTDDKKADK